MPISSREYRMAPSSIVVRLYWAALIGWIGSQVWMAYFALRSVWHNAIPARLGYVFAGLQLLAFAVSRYVSRQTPDSRQRSTVAVPIIVLTISRLQVWGIRDGSPISLLGTGVIRAIDIAAFLFCLTIVLLYLFGPPKTARRLIGKYTATLTKIKSSSS